MSYYTHFNFSERPDSVEIGIGAGQFKSAFKGDEFVSHYENLSEADKNRLTSIYITRYAKKWILHEGQNCISVGKGKRNIQGNLRVVEKTHQTN